MSKINLKEEAKNILISNLKASGGKYISPDIWPRHSMQWLWDSCFHAIVCQKLGLNDLAENEIRQLLKWQKPTGWIPHEIYSSGRKIFDPEALLYKKGHRRFHSSITQPPVMAQSLEGMDQNFIKEVLPQVINFYLYFSAYRDPDDDGLIEILSPSESGRDFAPEFDSLRWSGNRKVDDILQYLWLLWLELNYKMLDWNIKRIWKKNLFKVEDLTFNCVWIEGLRILSRLSGGDENLSKLAERAESAIIELCWDIDDKIFYNLDSNNKKMKSLSVNCLSPLLLDNLPKEMGNHLVGHLLNPEEFWTPFPIPSVAKTSPAFEPDYGERKTTMTWRGPTWVNMNWFIVKGLLKHGYDEAAKELAKRTWKMVEENGFWESYHPITGEGLRNKGFGWSTLVVTFEDLIK